MGLDRRVRTPTCAEHEGHAPWRRRPCAAAEEGNTERVPRRERGGGGEHERDVDDGGEERVGGSGSGLQEGLSEKCLMGVFL